VYHCKRPLRVDFMRSAPLASVCWTEPKAEILILVYFPSHASQRGFTLSSAITFADVTP